MPKPNLFRYLILYTNRNPVMIFTLRRGIGQPAMRELGRRLCDEYGYPFFHFSTIVENYEH